eukprot:scaffold44767_cov60-Phaeocystis_antarctica.AAC.1
MRTGTDRKHLEFALRRALFVAAEAHNERRIAIGGQALADYALGYLVNPPSAWPGFSLPLSTPVHEH